MENAPELIKIPNQFQNHIKITQENKNYELNLEYSDENITFNLSEENLLLEKYSIEINFEQLKSKCKAFSSFHKFEDFLKYINLCVKNHTLIIEKKDDNKMKLHFKQNSIFLELSKIAFSPEKKESLINEQFSLLFTKMKTLEKKFENVDKENILMKQEINDLKQENRTLKEKNENLNVDNINLNMELADLNERFEKEINKLKKGILKLQNSYEKILLNNIIKNNEIKEKENNNKNEYNKNNYGSDEKNNNRYNKKRDRGPFIYEKKRKIEENYINNENINYQLNRYNKMDYLITEDEKRENLHIDHIDNIEEEKNNSIKDTRSASRNKRFTKNEQKLYDNNNPFIPNIHQKKESYMNLGINQIDNYIIEKGLIIPKIKNKVNNNKGSGANERDSHRPTVNYNISSKNSRKNILKSEEKNRANSTNNYRLTFNINNKRANSIFNENNIVDDYN